MIVYRAQEHAVCAAEVLAGIRRDVRKIENATAITIDCARDLLIRFGEFEAAVADSLSPDHDEDIPERRVLRHASVAFGRLFYRTLTRHCAAPLTRRCARSLSAVAELALPQRVTASVPEGYAYYGLYPETYIDAAERCFHELQPSEVVVVGIRGIGASLASIVAACFEELGCHVRSHTVRPHGHPFDRVVRVSGALQAQWTRARSALFVIVDEGPGLSGSSFAAVTNLLASIGVAARRIVLLPSWNADPARFVNENARAQWSRLRKFVADADGALRPEGRELSAGVWRPLVFEKASDYPAVQPQHERRKYLDDSGFLHKFAGLGVYGSAKLPVAAALADGGFAPKPAGFSNGYLANRFAAGRPLLASDASETLLDRIASYAAFRKAKLPAERSVGFEAILELIRVNSEEGLASAYAISDQAFAPLRSEFDDREAIAVDGRMLPHEWLATPRGFVKVDATDHHADHFFPGSADIAWDLAATDVEFRLRREQREYLMRQYTRFSADAPSSGLLSFYRIAYLSFRLGYCALASGPTAGTADHDRFLTLQLGYASRLESELSSYVRHVQVTA